MTEISPQKLSEQETEKRKKLIDEMYGYTENPTEEEKDELKELINKYMEYKKTKKQKPLKNVIGK